MAKKKAPVKKAKAVSKPAKKAATAKKSAKSAPKAKKTVAKKASAKPAPKAVAKKEVKAPAAQKTNKAPTTSPTKTNKSESFFKSYLKPLDDRIVVIVDEAEKRTPGGLYIPATVTDTASNYEGKVMAIGRGHMNKKGKVKPLDVSVGDKVVFSVFSGSHIDVDGNSIMVIRESDVLGIVK